jgi:riboflavin kinase / FMN adenylyltransferase
VSCLLPLPQNCRICSARSSLSFVGVQALACKRHYLSRLQAKACTPAIPVSYNKPDTLKFMQPLSIPVTSDQLHGCLAIGNFDGVHLGHAVMLDALRDLATEQGTKAVAVTFDPHPIAILRPEFTPPILTTVEDRVELLRAAGADSVIVLPVTTSLLEMTAEEFFQSVIVDAFHAKGVVEGPNFRFGRDRKGDTEVLRGLCESASLPCHIVSPVEKNGQLISSSRIRELLCSRSLRQATELLGHPYRVTGVVRRGAGRGAGLGFPTANLAEVATLLPAHGVYAGYTMLDGGRYPVAVSVGPNPTFGEHREKVECHIDGFSGELYEQVLKVDLLSEIRPLQSFDSIEILVKQIHQDVEMTRSLQPTVPSHS